jgi:hypothetical protein
MRKSDTVVITLRVMGAFALRGRVMTTFASSRGA